LGLLLHHCLRRLSTFVLADANGIGGHALRVRFMGQLRFD